MTIGAATVLETVGTFAGARLTTESETPGEPK
jgi:hypothetical protein